MGKQDSAIVIAIIIFSLIVTYNISGPQYFEPRLSEIKTDSNGFGYREGILEIGPIYGSIETTLYVGKQNYLPKVLISLDNSTWRELGSAGNFTRLGNFNIEKGLLLKFYLINFPTNSSEQGQLIFKTSAFTIFESPIKLILFLALAGFLFKIYDYSKNKYKKKFLSSKVT